MSDPDLCSSFHPVGRLSEDCEYFAYGLSSSGSDWVTVRFMNAGDLAQLPDVLERVKFSCLAWTHDAKGVFYNSYPRQEGKTDGLELLQVEGTSSVHSNVPMGFVSTTGTETTTNLNQKLYYHVIGTKQSEDVLVAEFPDHPKWHSSAIVSPTAARSSSP